MSAYRRFEFIGNEFVARILLLTYLQKAFDTNEHIYD